MALQSWNQYVADANREPQTLSISDTESLTITMPTEEQARAYNAALRTGNDVAKVKALLGDDNGGKILALSAGAPVGALDHLLNDVLVEFGLRPGKGSSNSSN